MTSDMISEADKEFLANCEEEFKHRYSDKDKEFMIVFNSEPSSPPIVDPWWVPNSGRGNDRRNSRRNYHNSYERQGNRDRSYQEHRGYNDYNHREENQQDGYNKRRRYY